jgi:uncharacterized protein YndB with AHSA1/START domain
MRRALVFETSTDPKHLAHWWGPNGFTLTTYEMEFKPGGVWRLVMHGPDGRNYQNTVVYVEIADSERLIYRHPSPPEFQMTVTFADEGKKPRSRRKCSLNLPRCATRRSTSSGRSRD